MELVFQIGLGIALGSLIKFLAELTYLPIRKYFNDKKALKDINEYQKALGKPTFKSIKEYNDQWLKDVINAEVEASKPKTRKKTSK